MEQQKLKPNLLDPIAITIGLVYLSFGLAWINFSDLLVYSLFADVSLEHLTEIQTYKGFFFVGITALMLYILVLRFQTIISKQQLTINRAKQHAQHFTQSLPIPYAEFDHQGTCTHANQAFRDTFDLKKTRSELLNIDEIRVSEQRLVTSKEWNALVSGSKHDLVKKIALKPDSDRMELATISLHPFRDVNFELKHVVIYIS